MQSGGFLVSFAHVVRSVSLAFIIVITALLVTSCALAALGFLPWLTFTAQFDTFAVPQAGMITQIALTCLMIALCFFVPASARMLALERSHRNFRINMEDVKAAYQAAHAADRGGVFTAKSEFDGVRERMEYLRDHPQLHVLEADLLTVAAQMSEKSQHLASVYSTENLTRAKEFLIQRQQEIDLFEARLETAKALTADLRRWQDQQSTETAVQQALVDRLQRELLELMPELGFELEEDEPPLATAKVVALPQKPGPHHSH